MTVEDYVARIRNATARSRSESKLEGQLNQILEDCLKEFGIPFDPHVNETLKSLGLSQVDGNRPDGVFGHIVYDYKAPGVLSRPRDLAAAKKKLQEYLDSITGGHSSDPAACASWFGYLCDGRLLLFCRSDRQEWKWTSPLPISKNTLLLLIHAYRGLSRRPLTAALLSQAFGKDSEVARELIRLMCSHLAKPKHRTNMLFREWRRLFEQVSTYDLDQLPSLKRWANENGIATKDASHILFAIHTYYGLVVKILTSEMLSAAMGAASSICGQLNAASSMQDVYAVMGQLEEGEYYRRLRITNFLEGDFFSWYTQERSQPLADAIQALAREFLAFEPASAILLPDNKKDLLKEFYSSLVDEQIRHDLGEYYTPDWLAERLLDDVGYRGQRNARLLDPACGSGTFLVESISRLRDTCNKAGMPDIQVLDTILTNIKGIDLNPLAVISARANYILSIFDLAFGLGHDIELPVYLADAINVPVEMVDPDGESYLQYLLDTEPKKFTIDIPLSLVRAQVLGKVLLACEDAIVHGHDFPRLEHTLRRNPPIAKLLTSTVIDRLKTFYEILTTLEKQDWDKIWCRIIKNNFSPRGFAPFHYIVGNPPWVRWSRLPETYRNRVKKFCDYYGLVSGRGYSGGIETDISTVITFSSADNWLADGGALAFLITWTVYKTSSARGFRMGQLPNGRGLLLKRIEDLTRIQPFPDATNETAVYVARKVSSHRKAKFSKVPCTAWEPATGSSRIPSNSTLPSALQSCKVTDGMASPVRDWGSPLWTGHSSDYRAASFLRGRSKYLPEAHRGIVTDAARVYWVRVSAFSSQTGRALIHTLTPEELPSAREVPAVDGAWIESDLLYPLMRGRDVGRHSAQTHGWYQLIPNKHYEEVASEDEFADQYPLTYSYLSNFESILRNRSTYKRYQSHLPFYVVYCVGDYTFSRYKVVWLEQQDPRQFRAAVVSSLPGALCPNKILIPDHKLYFASLNSAAEAHYLSGFLNSSPVRAWLGGFLHGKQIGTSIFEYMNVPKYDPSNPDCKAISNISKTAHRSRTTTRNTTLLSDDAEAALTAHVRRILRS